MRYLEIPEHYTYSVNHERPRIDYQNELFEKVYEIQSLLSPIEHLDLERTPFVSEALAILIHFVIEHDYHIIQKLSRPQIIDSKRYMILGNNALEQLSVVSKDRNELTLLKLIDKSATAIGKRLLKERLLNPVMEREELERRYGMIEKVTPHVRLLEETLRGIYDIERLSRRIRLGRLHPFEMNYVYESLIAVRDLMAYIKKHKIQKASFSDFEVEEFIREIEKSFDLETSRRFTMASLDDNFLRRGVDAAIDALVDENAMMLQEFGIVMDTIESMLGSVSASGQNRYVSLGLLDKEGYYITLSKNRWSMIETEFYDCSIDLGHMSLTCKEFSVKKLTNNVKITSDYLRPDYAKPCQDRSLGQRTFRSDAADV